jgi:hypothetical protein
MKIYLFQRDIEVLVIWFQAMKMKKWKIHFGMAMMYFRVCHQFVDYFSRMNGYLKAFIELDCIHSFQDIHLVHIIAGISGGIYALSSHESTTLNSTTALPAGCSI